MSTTDFHDPDVIALRIQRLERVVLALYKLIVKWSCGTAEKDVNLALDLNAISMNLPREKAIFPPEE